MKIFSGKFINDGSCLVIVVESNSLHDWLIGFIANATKSHIRVYLITLAEIGPIHDFFGNDLHVIALSFQKNKIKTISHLFRIKSHGILSFYSIGHKPNLLATILKFTLGGQVTMNYVQQTDYFIQMAKSNKLLVSVKGTFHESISKWYFRNSDFVQSVSLTTERKLLSIGVPERKIVKIPLGVSFERSSSTESQQGFDANGLSSLQPFLLSVARLAPEKNHYLTIDAFSYFIEKYPNFRLVILGEGPLKKQLQDYLKQVGLQDKVLFAGFRSDVDTFYRLCSVFVHSAHTEGYASVQMEARLRNKPIVSTATGVVLDMQDLGDPYVRVFEKISAHDLSLLWVQALEQSMAIDEWNSPHKIYSSHNQDSVYKELVAHFMKISQNTIRFEL